MFKKRNEKGFTLAELLIVVAIIAVLVAIAIPIFTAQLEKSREATDVANIRAAYAEASVDALDKGAAGTATSVEMVSNGKIEKIDTTAKIGNIPVGNITVKKGEAVTVEVDENGNVTLSGGASASN